MVIFDHEWPFAIANLNKFRPKQTKIFDFMIKTNICFNSIRCPRKVYRNGLHFQHYH